MVNKTAKTETLVGTISAEVCKEARSRMPVPVPNGRKKSAIGANTVSKNAAAVKTVLKAGERLVVQEQAETKLTHGVDVRPLFTIQKAAETLGMSESWMRKQNEIAFVRINNRKLFDQSDIESFILRNKKNVSPASPSKHGGV